ncbi:MAG: hypothetical protein LC772_09785, partial [Chloroflexi bacterium]|nr:hypothetical protein [Chloroflexota bacterium]
DQELEGRLQRLERQLQRTRHTIDQFASNQGITRNELIAQLRDQAEIDVTEYLLLLRVASAEGIEITPDEVDAQIEREGTERGSRPAVIEIEKKNETRRSGVRYEMTKQRILDRIVERAHVERHGPSAGVQPAEGQVAGADPHSSNADTASEREPAAGESPAEGTGAED